MTIRFSAAIFLLFLVGCGDNGEPLAPGGGNLKVEKMPLDIQGTLSAPRLYWDYASELAGDRKYKDKVLEAAGGFRESRVDGDNFWIGIRVKSNRDSYIRVYLRQDQKEQAAKLKVGKPVKFRAICRGRQPTLLTSGREDYIVILTDGILIP